MRSDNTQTTDLRASTTGSRRPGIRTRLPFGAMLPRAIISLLLTIAFFLIGHAVTENQPLRIDHWMAETIGDHTGSRWERIMRVVTELGGGIVTVPLMLGFTGWLLRRRRKSAAAIVAGFWIGSKVIDQSAKAWYQRDRPSFFPHLMDAAGYSYPSGHTVTALMTYGLIAAVLFHCAGTARRWVVFSLAALVTVWVAASRMVLGVHYFSDVAGSVLIAGAWLQTAIIVLAWAEPCVATGNSTGEPATD